MKTMNNNQNCNSRPTTFVEELGSVIRRNSTVQQFIGGDFAIVNGDVEARVIVSCSNAAYRNKQQPTIDNSVQAPVQPTAIDNSVQAPVQHDAIITAKQELENLQEKHAESSFSEKLADDYYNKSSRLKTTISDAEDEDLLVNILTGLQLTRKFKELNYSIRSDFSFIDKRTVSKRLDFILTSFGIDTQLAKNVYNCIHDCLSFDVFTIKAKNNNVYIICGNADGVVETFCSATASETSMQFITRMMEANKP